MRTNDNIKDEIFGSLEFLTEIDDVGREFLTGRGQTRNLRSTFLQMQAFVRQAKTFYNSAETLHFRASPLNYYYSFLNLVKAYISITNPNAVSGNVYHGLISPPKRSVASSRQSVETRKGVFPIFYQHLTGSTLRNKTRLKVYDLLGYCSDVALEYEIGKFGNHRISYGNIAIPTDVDKSNFFVLLSIREFEKLEAYTKTLFTFRKCFEEVDLEKNVCREIFNIQADEKEHCRFFESRTLFPLNKDDTIPTGKIANYAFKALDPIFEPNTYREEWDFRLVAPLRKNLQIRMREPLAVYAVMFYLASLVRYDPAYLERIYESREAWIIERFTKTAPITFLRRIRNLIDNRNFIYVSR